MADTVMYSVATDEHPQLDANPPLTATDLQVNSPTPRDGVSVVRHVAGR
jgi:hypothetical protein